MKLRVGVQKDGIRAILEKSGQLKDLPYEISFSTFAFGPPLVEAAGADKIDVAASAPRRRSSARPPTRTSGSSPTIQYRNQKDDAILVPGGLGDHQARAAEGQDDRGRQGQLRPRPACSSVLNRVGPQAGRREARPSWRRPTRWPRSRPARSTRWSTWHPFIQQAEAEGAQADRRRRRRTSTGTRSRSPRRRRSRIPKRAAALKDYVARLQKAFAWAADEPGRVGRGVVGGVRAARWPSPRRRCAERLLDIVPIDDADDRAPAGARRPADRGQGPPRRGRSSTTIVTQGLIEGG